MKADADDTVLLDRIRASDMDAMAAFYDRFAPRIFALAARTLRDASEAEEIVQDVFLQAWRQRDRYDSSRGSVGAWLIMMARSRALDRLRQKRSFRTQCEDCLSVFPEAPSGLEGRDAIEALTVRDCVARLPVAQRVALELAFFCGYTHAEVASRLKQPLGTIKSRIRVALTTLRDAIERGPSSPDARQRETPFSVCLTEFLAVDPAMPFECEPLDGTRVLIVDDDREACELVRTVLESAGACVDSSTSARDALHRLMRQWPDVLIADIRMPGEDGYTFIRHARILAQSSQRRLRAAAFTALAREQDRVAAIQAGYTVHLAKPVQPDALVQAVARLASTGA